MFFMSFLFNRVIRITILFGSCFLVFFHQSDAPLARRTALQALVSSLQFGSCFSPVHTSRSRAAWVSIAASRQSSSSAVGEAVAGSPVGFEVKTNYVHYLFLGKNGQWVPVRPAVLFAADTDNSNALALVD